MKLWSAIALLEVANAASIPAIRVSGMDGRAVTVETSKAKATVVVFYSVLCPISNEYNDRMSQLFAAHKNKEVQFVFLNANDNESAAEIKKHAKLAGFPFPVYKDTHNEMADLLNAQATPEAFVLDSRGVVRYHGYIDDSKNEARVKVHGLRDAIDAVMAGKPVPRAETKSFGCTIKRYRSAS